MMEENSRQHGYVRSGRRSKGELVRELQQEITSGVSLPGDRYMSVREVADRFSISPNTAHIVMQELAKRQVLEIRPRVGAFVARATPDANSRVKIIHFIIRADPVSRKRFLHEGLQEGLAVAMPGMAMQLNILPQKDGEEYLGNLFLQHQSDVTNVGAVLMSVPRWVRLYFSEKKLPAVVIGHAEEDIGLPYVDRDQYAIGREVASFLIGKGHTSFGLLMREQWFPGDNLQAEGIEGILGDQKQPECRLTIQSLSNESSLAQGAIRRMLAGPNRPTALICRSTRIAIDATKTAGELDLKIPSDLAVACLGTDDAQLRNADPPITAMSYDGWELGMRAGQFLLRLAKGEWPGNVHVKLPSRLVERRST